MTHILNILRSGGLVMIPLGLLSLVALAIVLERFWRLRSGNFMKPAVVSTLRELLVGGHFKQAVTYCKSNPGPFSDLVATLVENRFAPYDELKQIMEDTARHRLYGLQRGLGALGTIVAGAPLLGLLGTVIGMIKIFSVVASAGSQVTEALSLGISEALITTASGLIIAIPALFAHSFLESRAGGIITDMETQLIDLLHFVRRSEGKTEDEEEAA
ncbi:MAG: MotA/TolQ/ExbB proton channel family protein [Thermoanaerobaculales bacterium]|nr:MotA/TolQ/ExbB proton channel family protein [Thermoanaerobaculales bacterium]